MKVFGHTIHLNAGLYGYSDRTYLQYCRPLVEGKMKLTKDLRFSEGVRYAFC